MNENSILIIFKDKKKVTKNQDFWNDKFSKKYKVFLFYLYDYVNLSNKEISKIINNKITELNIDVVLFEGDHVSAIDFNFINLINNSLS